MKIVEGSFSEAFFQVPHDQRSALKEALRNGLGWSEPQRRNYCTSRLSKVNWTKIELHKAKSIFAMVGIDWYPKNICVYEKL